GEPRVGEVTARDLELALREAALVARERDQPEEEVRTGQLDRLEEALGLVAITRLVARDRPGELPVEVAPRWRQWRRAIGCGHGVGAVSCDDRVEQGARMRQIADRNVGPRELPARLGARVWLLREGVDREPRPPGRVRHRPERFDDLRAAVAPRP